MKRPPIELGNFAMKLCLVLTLASLVTGCEEANLAIDKALGTRSISSADGKQSSAQKLIPAVKQAPGAKAPEPQDQTPSSPAPLPGQPKVQPAKEQPAQPGEKPAAPQIVMTGKRSAPGKMPPRAGEDAKQPQPFAMGRVPFEAPTEMLPPECPPSMPLCKFDRSQLKLVGVMQVSDGNYKGMVEDPDGRGYFVTTGMMIGRATITQIYNKGLILYDHRTNQDVPMTLASEGIE
jgi:hypothetical protein